MGARNVYAQDALDVSSESSLSQINNISSESSSISISPAILEVILEPGKLNTQEIYLINNTKFPLPIKGSVEQFAVDEAFIGSTERLDDTIFNASKWFTLSPSDFILQPGEEKLISVTIDPPKDAEPGGHYATVFFQPLIPETMVSKASAQMTTKIGALVLSIVKGEIREEAGIGKLQMDTFYKTGPIDISIPVTNLGNVHILPSGKVYIKNSKGQTLEEFPISPSSVMPKTQKNYNVVWDEKFLFGKYTAIGEISYGNDGTKLVSNSVDFWIIPWVHISAIIILLTGILLFFRLTYKNYIKAFKALVE